ncbi:MAG: DedA family protein [Proteobacteria bacterium]|nr:DedA family protein [Pseudomonadota bacterium]MBI3499424.1 DedA family protein [Pseudomonadota bacterium]
MLRKLYDRILALAGHSRATEALAFVSFVESSVFPIPPDVLLIPMVLARRERAWWYAFLCTLASVLGGFLGYAVGYYLFDAIGRPILEFYGYGPRILEFQELFNRYGWWIIVIKGMTPIPYKLVTIASGAAEFDLLSFAAASLISRALRFYPLTALLWWFGPPIRRFIEERMVWVTSVFALFLVGGFVLVRFLL